MPPEAKMRMRNMGKYVLSVIILIMEKFSCVPIVL